MVKFLIDLFPVVLFFLAYKSYDLFIATIVIVIASSIQMIALKLLKYKIEFMHWFSLLLIVFLGSITLLTQSASFIMYKVTAVNTVFALLLIYGHFFLKENFIQKLLGKKIQLAPKDWVFLNQLWIGFFVVIGALNYLFAKSAVSAKNNLLALDNSINELKLNLLNCTQMQEEIINACLLAKQTEEYWINFRFYGVWSITIAFIILMTIWLMKKQNIS